MSEENQTSSVSDTQIFDIPELDPKIKVKIFDNFYKQQKDIARAKYYNYETGVRDGKGFKKIVIKAPRRTGKSYCMDRMAIADALNKPNQSVLWGIPTDKQSKDALERFATILGMKLEYDDKKGSGNVEIRFKNNSVIEFRTAGSADSLRGKGPDHVYLDEFAFFHPSAYEVVIEPYMMANEDLCVVMASTPLGKNHFYDEYMTAKSGCGYKSIAIDLHYTMNPKVNLPFIESMRINKSPAIFQQEYEGQFILGASKVFGDYEHLQTIQEWSAPDKGLSYFYGIDWSSGSGADETVIAIIDNFGEVAYIKKMPKINEIKQVEVLAEIINKYECAYGYSEHQGMGQTCNTIFDTKGFKYKKYTATNTSKSISVGQLILDINTDNITLPTTALCPELDIEMNVFEVSTTKTGKLSYSHPTSGGYHDDHLDALCMANLCKKEMMFGGGNKVAKVNRVSKRKGHFKDNIKKIF